MSGKLSNFDGDVSILTEQVTRRFTRRAVLRSVLKGSVATVAAMSIGNLTGIRNVFATTCTCSYINHCTNFGYTCPSNYPFCPSQCTVCTSDGQCCSFKCGSSYCCHCDYTKAQGGQWLACTGLGNCRNGYAVCTDCYCGSCSKACTCLSGCQCCDCCTPEDVFREHQRLVLNATAN